VRAAGAYLEYREYDTRHKLNGAGMRKLKSWWAERV
jgi:predicted esterase